MAAKGQRKCSECGQFKSNVEDVLHPIAHDVDGIDELVKLCGDCHDMLALEV